ncbi:MAG TPA: hypothetical protein P5137_02805 [Candidatus Brocadiia bacterium]|nr:hypothetical protein [Candidatus Brocadiia bacterium]
MSKMIRRRVRYHLRASVTPFDGPAHTQELLRIVREGLVDEVMFFLPHAEEMSPGLGTDQECREARDRVRPIFDELRRMGVAASVNIWWTKSFSNFGLAMRDMRDRFDFRWAVSSTGASDYSAACPLDDRWLDEARRVYATFAELKPAILWFDDDVQARFRGGIRGACFCPVCLERAAGYTGAALDRAALVKSVLADPPNAARQGWLRFQADIMTRMVSALREAVHAVSPDTRMGVMGSSAEMHFAEGRRWAEHMKAACGPHRPLFRPPGGNYSQGALDDVIAGINMPRMAQAVAGADDDLAPELENYPHTIFNKSIRLCEAQMAEAQLLGLPEITLSILRFGGRLDLDPAAGPLTAMLRRIKPRLQAIADLAVTRDQHRGLGLFWHENVASAARARGAGDPILTLMRSRPWDAMLSKMGFATRYGASDVTVFTGEAIACLSRAEREALLSRGALLDARAAATVIGLGEGELIGMTQVLAPVDACQELVSDAAFGAEGEAFNTRFEGGKAAQFGLMPGTRVVSKMTTYGLAPTGHGMTLFANRLGGRVAVWPFDTQSEAGAAPRFLISFGRQRQMLDVVTWLAGAPPDLFVPQAPNTLPLLSVQPKRAVASVLNLSSDEIENVTLELRPLDFAIRRVRALNEAGKWRTLKVSAETTPSGALRIATGVPAGHMEVVVFTLD